MAGLSQRPRRSVDPAAAGITLVTGAQPIRAALRPAVASPVIVVSLPEPSAQAAAGDGSSITLTYGQTAVLNMDGATAAYSLESHIARATASAGVVSVVGHAPGTTYVVVTVGSRLEYIRVTVDAPPVATLPGFTPTGAPLTDTGTVDLRYGSEIGLLQGTVRLVRRAGDPVTELAM